MAILLAILVFAAGMGLGLQPTLNARLSAATGTFWAALISTGMSAIIIAMIVAVLRLPIPQADNLRDVPRWAWIGGIVGAVYVAAALAAIGRLGATAVVVLAISGQFFAATVADHFGLFDLIRRPLDTARVVGLAAIFGGVLLIVSR